LAALGEKTGIGSGFGLALGDPLLLDGEEPAFPLKADGSDETLDLGRLESLLLGVFAFLGGDFPAISQHVFSDIVFFAESEEFADF
jgi:hypothetical protein